MEGRAEALVLWLRETTDSPPINSIIQVRNCRLLEQILTQIDGFYFQGGTGSNEWKEHYSRLRSVYEQVETYLRESLKLAPPSSLSAINLVEMAKGQSEEGLQSLLLLVFIVCIRCPIKDNFIRCIMNLSESAQTELMRIIQDWQSDEAEQKEDDSQVGYYKQELARLEFHCQNLMQENLSLRASLEEYDERSGRTEEMLSKLQIQNEQLQLDLSERSEQLRLREENFLDKYAQHNQDIVEDLKKKLLQQEHLYSGEIIRLKQTVQSLQQSLGEVKRQNSQLLQMQDRRSMIQARDEHINCISIEKHKMKINEILAVNKETAKDNLQYKLEKIKLSNRIAELQANLKKQTELIRKKQSDLMMSTEDSSKIKVQVLTRLRDCLKNKLMDFKNKGKEGQPGAKVNIFDDDQQ